MCPGAVVSAQEEEEGEIVRLSPFGVSAEDSFGYLATNSATEIKNGRLCFEGGGQWTSGYSGIRRDVVISGRCCGPKTVGLGRLERNVGTATWLHFRS
jgi:hypothetical protein